MSIDKLKEHARRHEQAEEWSKALDFYLRAIEVTESSDEPDISLFNRVGDLQVRVGDVDGAVSTYERAVDLYMEAELPNNAIAICQKVIRNVPGRASTFLKMGQVRARQGFIVDARQNFLTYAEMKQTRGETAEAFRALGEFVRLAPRDVETRLFLAEQLVARSEIDDAVAHFEMAHRHLLTEGDEARAEAIRTRVSEVAPGVTLSSEPLPDEIEPPLQGGLVGFESTSMDDEIGFDDDAPPVDAPIESGELAFSDIGGGLPSGNEDDDEASDALEAAMEEVEPLPTLDMEDEEEEAPAGREGMELDDLPAPDPAGEQAWGDEPDEEEVGEDPGDFAMPDLEREEDDDGNDGSAGTGPGDGSAGTGPGDGYVDLGSMVLDEKGESTTRWKVESEAPSGDEQADFARMLSQFKEKVAQNLDTGDFTARYDLGAAYKDMGLMDEAIGEFQAALRADPRSLAALEMLGQCFLEKGEPQAAIRTLQRALAIPNDVEDDFLGIYYYLGQCYEVTGDTKQALEVYEKVFSLDINFMDVTERLRALR